MHFFGGLTPQQFLTIFEKLLEGLVERWGDRFEAMDKGIAGQRLSALTVATRLIELLAEVKDEPFAAEIESRFNEDLEGLGEMQAEFLKIRGFLLEKQGRLEKAGVDIGEFLGVLEFFETKVYQTTLARF